MTVFENHTLVQFHNMKRRYDCIGSLLDQLPRRRHRFWGLRSANAGPEATAARALEVNVSIGADRFLGLRCANAGPEATAAQALGANIARFSESRS